MEDRTPGYFAVQEGDQFFCVANIVDNFGNVQYRRFGPYATLNDAEAAAVGYNSSDAVNVRMSEYNQRGATVPAIAIATLKKYSDGNEEDLEDLEDIRREVQEEFPDAAPSTKPDWKSFRYWLKTGFVLTKIIDAVPATLTAAWKAQIAFTVLMDGIRDCSIVNVRLVIGDLDAVVGFTPTEKGLINTEAAKYNIPDIFV